MKTLFEKMRDNRKELMKRRINRQMRQLKRQMDEDMERARAEVYVTNQVIDRALAASESCGFWGAGRII